MPPLVSVVLLNWNGEKHVHRCLEHVAAQDYARVETIVVDNGSIDGSMRRIKENHPEFVYVQNDRNVGFAAGMNAGLKVSRGDFVVPLNQDVCLHSTFLSQCVAAMLDNERLGAVGGRVFAWVDDQLTDRLRIGEGEHWLVRKRFQADAGNFAEGPTLTFGATGSFPFLRRAMLEDLQTTSGCYYDESYETGWEDFDLWFRMHLRGWQCLFLPTAMGWHVGSGSVGGNATFFSKSLDYQSRVLRNRHFTIIKNLPGKTWLWLLPYLAATEAALIPYFLTRSPRSLSALFTAWWQVLQKLPELARKRSQIQASRVAGHLELKRYFVRF